MVRPSVVVDDLFLISQLPFLYLRRPTLRMPTDDCRDDDLSQVVAISGDKIMPKFVSKLDFATAAFKSCKSPAERATMQKALYPILSAAKVLAKANGISEELIDYTIYLDRIPGIRAYLPAATLKDAIPGRTAEGAPTQAALQPESRTDSLQQPLYSASSEGQPKQEDILGSTSCQNGIDQDDIPAIRENPARVQESIETKANSSITAVGHKSEVSGLSFSDRGGHLVDGTTRESSANQGAVELHPRSRSPSPESKRRVRRPRSEPEPCGGLPGDETSELRKEEFAVDIEIEMEEQLLKKRLADLALKKKIRQDGNARSEEVLGTLEAEAISAKSIDLGLEPHQSHVLPPLLPSTSATSSAPPSGGAEDAEINSKVDVVVSAAVSSEENEDPESLRLKRKPNSRDRAVVVTNVAPSAALGALGPPASLRGPEAAPSLSSPSPLREASDDARPQVKPGPTSGPWERARPVCFEFAVGQLGCPLKPGTCTRRHINIAEGSLQDLNELRDRLRSNVYTPALVDQEKFDRLGLSKDNLSSAMRRLNSHLFISSTSAASESVVASASSASSVSSAPASSAVSASSGSPAKAVATPVPGSDAHFNVCLSFALGEVACGGCGRDHISIVRCTMQQRDNLVAFLKSYRKSYRLDKSRFKRFKLSFEDLSSELQASNQHLLVEDSPASSKGGGSKGSFGADEHAELPVEQQLCLSHALLPSGCTHADCEKSHSTATSTPAQQGDLLRRARAYLGRRASDPTGRPAFDPAKAERFGLAPDHASHVTASAAPGKPPAAKALSRDTLAAESVAQKALGDQQASESGVCINFALFQSGCNSRGCKKVHVMPEDCTVAQRSDLEADLRRKLELNEADVRAHVNPARMKRFRFDFDALAPRSSVDVKPAQKKLLDQDMPLAHSVGDIKPAPTICFTFASAMGGCPRVNCRFTHVPPSQLDEAQRQQLLDFLGSSAAPLALDRVKMETCKFKFSSLSAALQEANPDLGYLRGFKEISATNLDSTVAGTKVKMVSFVDATPTPTAFLATKQQLASGPAVHLKSLAELQSEIAEKRKHGENEAEKKSAKRPKVSPTSHEPQQKHKANHEPTITITLKNPMPKSAASPERKQPPAAIGRTSPKSQLSVPKSTAATEPRVTMTLPAKERPVQTVTITLPRPR